MCGYVFFCWIFQQKKSQAKQPNLDNESAAITSGIAHSCSGYCRDIRVFWRRRSIDLDLANHGLDTWPTVVRPFSDGSTRGFLAGFHVACQGQNQTYLKRFRLWFEKELLIQFFFFLKTAVRGLMHLLTGVVIVGVLNHRILQSDTLWLSDIVFGKMSHLKM